MPQAPPASAPHDLTAAPERPAGGGDALRQPRPLPVDLDDAPSRDLQPHQVSRRVRVAVAL
jgi:hypothetical protein